MWYSPFVKGSFKAIVFAKQISFKLSMVLHVIGNVFIVPDPYINEATSNIANTNTYIFINLFMSKLLSFLAPLPPHFVVCFKQFSNLLTASVDANQWWKSDKKSFKTKKKQDIHKLWKQQHQPRYISWNFICSFPFYSFDVVSYAFAIYVFYV